MNLDTLYSAKTVAPYTSSAESAELFPQSIKTVFDRLDEISKEHRPNEVGPSSENIDWAKKVLLRIIPRFYVVGAEIDAFQSEIHVNWENGNKRVTVFLPAPDVVKAYCEEEKDGEIKHHLRGAADPWAVSGVLKWLFE